MKAWGNLPGAGGPRAAVVVRNEGAAEGEPVTTLAARQPSGVYLVVPLDAPYSGRRLFGEGGTEAERSALRKAGYKIQWRGPAAKPKYVPAAKRGG